MSTYLILLRTIHILAGVMWVGGAAIYFLFITAAARTAGPGGASFMQALMVRHRFPQAMTVASLLTIAAGFLLYWHASNGLQWNWIATGVGAGFSIGALAAMGAFLVGNLVLGPTVEKIAAMGPAGPGPDQAAHLRVLEARLYWAERADFVLLLIALLAMATARYWWF